MNQYAYVGNDPVNLVDPLGLDEDDPPIVVTGSRCPSGWTCYSPGDFVLTPYATYRMENSDGSVGRAETRICSNGATQVSTNEGESGNVDVTITVPISFTGPGAAVSSSGYIDAINETWSGSFGRYSVNTQTSIGRGGLVADIAAGFVGGRAEVGGRMLWLGTLGNANPGRVAVNFNIAAHEFGHTLGLRDRYLGTQIEPGYAGTIMGNGFSGQVTENTVSEAIRACAVPQL